VEADDHKRGGILCFSLKLLKRRNVHFVLLELGDDCQVPLALTHRRDAHRTFCRPKCHHVRRTNSEILGE